MVQGNNGAIGGACRPRGTEAATSVRRDGVSPKRVKKRIRKMALKGTPSTAAAAAETLEDIAAGTINAAVETIIEAEEDEDCTESQEVAVEAVELKKLQIKRRDE